MSKDNAAGGGGKTGTDEQEEEEFVAIEVDGNGKPVGVPDKEGADDDQDEQDASGLDDEDLDDDEGDTRLGHSDDDELTDETPEAKKERRRRENRARRIRNRVTADAREKLIQNQGKLLLQLQEEVAGLKGRTIQYDMRLLQQQLQTIEAQQTDAKSTYAALAKAGDGDGLAEVAEIQAQLRDQHRQTLQMLQRAKQQGGKKEVEVDDDGEPVTRPNGKGKQPATAAAPDPEVLAQAQEWAADKPWLNPQTNPEEFGIVRAIDETLIKRGLNPRTEQYWKELTKRVRVRLPERFKKAGAGANPGNGTGSRGGKNVENDNDGQRPAGGPRMATQSQTGVRPLGKNEVRVTPARKEAMIAAGKWEDPVKRNRQLAAYAKYDKEQATNQG